MQIKFVSLTGRWFSQGTPISSTNKTDCHNITESVESGIKHPNPNPNAVIFTILYFRMKPW